MLFFMHDKDFIMSSFSLSGNIIDPQKKTIKPGTLFIENGYITDIIYDHKTYSSYICPGFIDAHVHIESSLLTPYEFARCASTHGTVAVACDSHEIANVLGVDGVLYMMDNSKDAPCSFFHGVPSSVPATPYETAGATLNQQDTFYLFKQGCSFLSEVMNVQGVIEKDKDILEKIRIAQLHNRPIDGHAPLLRGNALNRYIKQGISTDHECSSYEEAREKIEKGMRIHIRQGSAAHNFNDLYTLIEEYPDKCMLCTDDIHPEELYKGHINKIVAMGIAKGLNLFDILYSACVTPVHHYNMNIGLLHKGDPADFIILQDLTSFTVSHTYIKGQCVSTQNTSLYPYKKPDIINNFHAHKQNIDNFKVQNKSESQYIHIIKASSGSLITEIDKDKPLVKNGYITQDIDRDILKLAVVNRYQPADPACAFIKGFGIKDGALAGSVAHDSHNIISVASDDTSLCHAINMVISHKGGLAIVNTKKQSEYIMPLDIAGLMSNLSYEDVCHQYKYLTNEVNQLQSSMSDPFMTLSFMALLVIPHIKLSNKGLFNGDTFSFIDM
jgi:adenine deaminase